jgi:hypothetical protein
MRSTAVRTLLAAVLALGLSGCSVEHRVTGPLPWQPQPPVADSPTNAIRVFEWGWNHRDLGAFRGLLTDDFRFVFALGDSAGNAYRDDPITREWMLGCLTHLFVGGGSAAPAERIALAFDPTLRVFPDSRPGKAPRWHKEILTGVDLAIKTEDGAEYRIMGNARFFVVRGDSAMIPAGLGAGPDSTRWYLQQWNDETLSGAGSASLGEVVTAGLRATLPATNSTWGRFLALYHQ